MKFPLGLITLGFTMIGLSTASFAQSGSFGGGSAASGPNAAEESFFGSSYSSQASACSKAKGEAAAAGKRRPNLADTQLGACSCSTTKKKLVLPQLQGQYFLETGQANPTDPVDVYECTVDARFIFNR